MSILSVQDPKANQDLPKTSSFWKSLLKQVLIAFFASGIMLAMYLMVVNDRKIDEVVGKYAYSGKDGVYIGVIEGRGRKSGVKVYFIKQAGSIISMDERYIVVKDSAPKYD
jgi:hypothetical protein